MYVQYKSKKPLSDAKAMNEKQKLGRSYWFSKMKGEKHQKPSLLSIPLKAILCADNDMIPPDTLHGIKGVCSAPRLNSAQH